jgi:hypothetical protein
MRCGFKRTDARSLPLPPIVSTVEPPLPERLSAMPAAAAHSRVPWPADRSQVCRTAGRWTREETDRLGNGVRSRGIGALRGEKVMSLLRSLTALGVVLG